MVSSTVSRVMGIAVLRWRRGLRIGRSPSAPRVARRREPQGLLGVPLQRFAIAKELNLVEDVVPVSRGDRLGCGAHFGDK